jgi:hypothetical protein
VTNLDRIKEMSAEEFIEFIGGDNLCHAIRWNDPEHCKWHEEHSDCSTCLVKYLKKDVNYDDL